MKRKRLFLGGFLLTILFTIFFLVQSLPIFIHATEYSEQEKQEVLSSIKPSVVYAAICQDGELYSNYEGKKAVVGEVYAGQTVEIIEDRTKKWYFVKSLENQQAGWIENKFLSIAQEDNQNVSPLTKRQKEIYAALSDFQSNTDYFVWVDIARQEINLFCKKNSDWKLEKVISCATGKNISPTLRGTFQLEDRGEWFYSDRLQSGAKYWVRYHESYLFHSVAMDKNQNIIDPVLGQKRSSGCVRMSVEDANWFFNNVPQSTGVYIH